jgi:DNA-binding transcriptional regulator YdaS (Cro superfamily)
MKLNEYIRKERGRLLRIAQQTGLAPSFLSQIACGRRKAPIKHCRAISAASGGEVSLRDLREQDWRVIWPEAAETGAADLTSANSGAPDPVSPNAAGRVCISLPAPKEASNAA